MTRILCQVPVIMEISITRLARHESDGNSTVLGDELSISDGFGRMNCVQPSVTMGGGMQRGPRPGLGPLCIPMVSHWGQRMLLKLRVEVLNSPGY